MDRALASFFEGSEGNVKSDPARGIWVKGSVWVHPESRIGPGVVLEGPTWLGAGVEVRPGAYIRGGVLADCGVVLGHSVEVKHALLLESAQVPHFNYVGDSVLGSHAHLGAGVILSNLRFDQQPVRIRDFAGQSHATGLRKLGGLLGDHAEVGCNAVLQPGTILGRKALVYPSQSFRGTLAEGAIAATAGWQAPGAGHSAQRG